VRLRDEGKRKDVLAGKAIRQIKSQMSQLNRPEVKALLERLEAADRERQAAGSGAGGRARPPPPAHGARPLRAGLSVSTVIGFITTSTIVNHTSWSVWSGGLLGRHTWGVGGGE
jgi:hypothetical protein